MFPNPVQASAKILTNKNVEIIFTPKSIERSLLENASLWHKIVVHNTVHHDKYEVLDAILNAVKPEHFVILSFNRGPKDYTFVARNCVSALLKLCRDNLRIPGVKNEVFQISVILGFSDTTRLKFPVHDSLETVIQGRINEKKILDLSNFHKEPVLDGLIYCPLALPKIFEFVMSIAKKFEFIAINLSRNEIEVLGSLANLKILNSLKEIDLRHNKISNMSVLHELKFFNIVSLWLDGNPVCADYTMNTRGYWEAAKEICPHLERIDGVIFNLLGIPPFRRNFVIDSEGKLLTDQFLEHFFTLYDVDRGKLVDMYLPNSIFTMSSSQIYGQSTTGTVRLDMYKAKSRNFWKMESQRQPTLTNFFYGKEKIKNVFRFLPKTEHDPYSFTVDLISYSECSATIYVNGVFREPSERVSLSENILYFSRSFVLVAGRNGEYNILNEQLHVSNATTIQAQLAFRNTKVIAKPESIPTVAHSKNDERLALAAMVRLTTMNEDWCYKLLEQTNWDIKKALDVFVVCYKEGEIPNKAFEP